MHAAAEKSLGLHDETYAKLSKALAEAQRDKRLATSGHFGPL